MKITNKLCLPDALIKAVSEREPEENVYHATELLKSTREIILTRKHWNDITVDVSDCINTIFGSAVHKVLELASPQHAEIPLEAKICGITVRGRIDKYEDGVIIDYKTCKRSHKDFEAWRMQGLIYAYLIYLTQNTKPKEIRFYGLVKDAIISRGDATIIPYIYKISDNDLDFISTYLENKIKELKSGIVPECTDSEKWKQLDTWALFKNKDSARALKILDHEPTPEEAQNYYVVKRVGELKKCKYFCSCRKVCPLNKK